MTSPLISVVVPVRNESGCIEHFLDGVFSQKGGQNIEVIVADGLSDDGTRELLERRALVEKRLVIISNKGRIVSTGLNAAIRAARGDFIVRMDAHTSYANDYISCSVSILKSSGADNVGGPWQAKGSGYLQSAIALAFQSPFSSGGALSRRVTYEGWVDSVYLGCWRKETLLRLGLFDEKLVRNQDDELNLRLIRGGGRVWQSPLIKSWYFPRSSLRALFKQYTQYGYWKVFVIRKHRLPASIRHVVPGVFMALLFLAVLSAVFMPWGLLLFIALLSSYFSISVCLSIITCRKVEHWRYILVFPVVFSAYHFGYAIGSLFGVVDFVVLKRDGRKAYGKLTR